MGVSLYVVAAIMLAVLGMGMVGYGSWIAGKAARHGLTVLGCFPAWLFGGALGGIALFLAFGRAAPSWLRWVVGACAALALASVTGAFGISGWHENWRRKKDEG